MWALDSEDRLRALDELGAFPGVPDETFDCYTRLVSRLLGAPVALLSLVSADRQFFPSSIGLAEPWATRGQTPLTMSFCQHVVTRNEPLIVTDASSDPRVSDNPAVGELGVRAYLGTPLRAPGGEPLGSLCAIDDRPRAWTVENLADLQDVADAVATTIALRLSEDRQRRDATEASHHLRTPITALRLELEDLAHWPQVDDDTRAALAAAVGHVSDLAGIVDGLLDHTRSRVRVQERDVDLSGLVTDALERVRGELPTDTEVVFRPEGPVPIRAVAPILRGVLDLLLEKAVTPKGRTVVEVTVGERDTCHVGVVTDPGPTVSDWSSVDDVARRIGGRLTVSPGPPLRVELVLPAAGRS